jgi:hypothetical protein
MSCTDLYTKEELITLIKALDVELAGGLKRSELDTTTDRQEFELDPSQMKAQRDFYYVMLQQMCGKSNGGDIVTLEPPKGPFG